MAAVITLALLSHAAPAVGTTTAGAVAQAERLLRTYDPLLGAASRLFAPPTRDAFVAIYAWCRRADQIVDAPEGSPAEVLAQLRARREALRGLFAGEPVDPLDALLQRTCARYPALREELFTAMLDAMEADAQPVVRYETWPELERYCYGVAGVVGEMSLPLLLEEHREDAVKPAVALGNAIQLCNILRDLRTDAALGRLYLPAEDLRRFGLDEGDIFAALGRQDPACGSVRELMLAQTHRARALIADGVEGIRMLPQSVRFAVRSIAELHLALLDRLDEYEDRPFGERVKLSAGEKAAVIARTWLQMTTASVAPAAAPPSGAEPEPRAGAGANK